MKPILSLFLVFFWMCSAHAAETKRPPLKSSPKTTQEKEVEKPVELTEYTQSQESVFLIRSSAPLEISNRRGSIEVIGWSQDKIKVIAVKKAKAASPEESRTLLGVAEPRYLEHDGWIELSAHYGGDLGIKERLKERQSPKISMDLIVYAPVHLKLTVFAIADSIKITNWKNNIALRSTSSKVQISGVVANQLDVTCPDCDLTIKSIKASVKCYGGSAPIQLSTIQGEELYVETKSGNIQVEDVLAKQILVTQTGNIAGNRLTGSIEFQSESGHVKLTAVSGASSGKTEGGNVDIQSLSWGKQSRSVIESRAGEINLTLPANFSAEVEIHAEIETPLIEFPVNTEKKNLEDPKVIRGHIGYDLRSGFLKVETTSGKIKVRKGS